MIWTDKDAEILKSFLDGTTGQKFIKKLELMGPAPICEPLPHQNSYRLGGVADRRQCICDVISLSVVKPPPKVEPQADYGVKDKATPA